MREIARAPYPWFPDIVKVISEINTYLRGSLMTIKKSLVALGTAAAVTIAGTGIANAADNPAETGDANSASGSNPVASAEAALSNGKLDPAGSVDFHNLLNPTNEDGALDINVIGGNLIELAKGAAAITTIAGAYVAVVNASDAWQGVVDDTTAFLQNQGVL
jgi:hypothetical protein